jgi:AmmeMemoRadiSam system protein B
MEEKRKDTIRQPAVAARFYSGSADTLKAEVMGYLGQERKPVRAIGAVMPHAGYMYSGGVAGETAAAMEIPNDVIILGPNHTGLGPAVSVYPNGVWRMPFGDLSINETLAQKILSRCELATPDEMAHLREHSIEVQLPFLYYRGDHDLTFVPIALSMLEKDECRLLGKALADIISELKEDTLLVSSSDMTHYESHQSAKEKDSEAIARILDLDPDGLLDVVQGRRISMCGIIPTAVMLYAALSLGARGASLVRYSTSGDVSGDYEQVVGYAGIIVY